MEAILFLICAAIFVVFWIAVYTKLSDILRELKIRNVYLRNEWRVSGKDLDMPSLSEGDLFTSYKLGIISHQAYKAERKRRRG
ncbi:hypothetical protein [Marinoscillum furvescens]|uniref:Uncharacterized protein n=1 Tax=Marinoscillum furvescens DSM 4134 TaxID=1122208 RepID=A0A3D9L6J7_MARFU|nr:hypothetical protein [Marinoscillum furvescens]REE01094.1 hypothetical protein C7460_104114 [Marinoscillum furvescens DSM 4134]